MASESLTHPLEPIWDEHSKILILGTFPSVKSREAQFYYGHPQNRFWKVLSTLLEEPLPQSIEEKKKLLLHHHIALWDVIKSCTIIGSQDASITDVIPNDLSTMLQKSTIQAIFLNGKKAYYLFQKIHKVEVPGILLPSTSPANATYRLDDLVAEWKLILTHL